MNNVKRLECLQSKYSNTGYTCKHLLGAGKYLFLLALMLPVLVSCAAKPSLKKTIPDISGLESKYVQVKMEDPNQELEHLKSFPLKDECDFSYLQDGFNLHYVTKGEGEPLILLHGYPANTFEWRRNIEALSEHFKVYAIDQRGFGLSDKLEDADFKLPSYIMDLKGFMDAMDLEKAHLVGNSFGGGIAWGTAYAFPERVETVVAIDPIVYPFEIPLQFSLLKFPGASTFAGTFPRFNANWVLEDLCYYDVSKIDEQTIDGYSVQLHYPEARRTMTEFIKTNKPEDYQGTGKLLQEIQTSTLIIWGEEDQLVPTEHAHRMHEDMPNSSLQIIPECGHIPPEEEPEIVNKAIIDFIKNRQLAKENSN
ncbi:MAG: alpha/beta fold hydrolase [Thermodesulfobacteriota bacterium]